MDDKTNMDQAFSDPEGNNAGNQDPAKGPARAATLLQPGFSNSQLKMIAIIAMFIDHLAWAFVPTASLQGQIMHAIGRLTFPIMAFFIAEGFYKTSNLKKYFLRLLSFALITHFPFQYFYYGRIPLFSQQTGDTLVTFATTSIMYTLLLGLTVLIIWKKTAMNDGVKLILTVLLLFLAIPGDYAYFGVLLVMAFGFNYPNRPSQLLFGALVISVLALPMIFSGSGTSLFMAATYLPLYLIQRYNGELGKARQYKWFFYWFYPVHLVLIALAKVVILK